MGGTASRSPPFVTLAPYEDAPQDLCIGVLSNGTRERLVRRASGLIELGTCR